jgi:hypothetical protein
MSRDQLHVRREMRDPATCLCGEIWPCVHARVDDLSLTSLHTAQREALGCLSQLTEYVSALQQRLLAQQERIDELKNCKPVPLRSRLLWAALLLTVTWSVVAVLILTLGVHS